ncbi:hypothetical protein BpHYR1_029568, partial [Brachionus plicatilis]
MEYQTIKLFDSKSFEIKRKKSPIKGLAFKESKRGLENFKENLIEEESVFSIKNDLKDEDISQSKQDFRNISADKNIRPNYKEMLKGIKKGKILKSDEFLAGTQKATVAYYNNTNHNNQSVELTKSDNSKTKDENKLANMFGSSLAQ